MDSWPSSAGYTDAVMDAIPAPGAARPRRPNARGQGELLREEIITTALRMLDEVADDQALSLRAVARALSISPTSVYLYFPDRDALVLAAMQRCHEDLVRAGDDAQAAPEGPAAALRAGIQARAAWAQEHPGLFKVLHESQVNRRLGMPFKRVMLDHITLAVQRCMDAGIAPPGDAATVALDLRAAVNGLLSLRINEPDMPWPPAVEQIDRFLAKIVGLPPAPGNSGLPGERLRRGAGAG
jgi:AcrR family transcriptional regulator